MIKKKEYFNKLKFYSIVILISFVPILVVSYLIYGKVSDIVSWIITATLLAVALFIGAVIERKMEAKKEKNKPQKDPFAD